MCLLLLPSYQPQNGFLKWPYLMPCLPSTLIHYDNTNHLSSMLTFSLDSLSFHTINVVQMKYILYLTIHKDLPSTLKIVSTNGGIVEL